MTHKLQYIFELEEKEQFEEAFQAYNKIYSANKGDYDIWKHFYFFLWTAIEDTPSSFHDKINLRHRLQVMYEEGKVRFPDKADFNFVAGYTVSIFPYEYGNYEDLEKQGEEMLLKATLLEPNNLIYKLAHLGSLTNVDQNEYRQAEIETAPKVLETFKGTGLFNKYFRQVLYWLDKNPFH